MRGFSRASPAVSTVAATQLVPARGRVPALSHVWARLEDRAGAGAWLLQQPEAGAPAQAPSPHREPWTSRTRPDGQVRPPDSRSGPTTPAGLRDPLRVLGGPPRPPHRLRAKHSSEAFGTMGTQFPRRLWAWPWARSLRSRPPALEPITRPGKSHPIPFLAPSSPSDPPSHDGSKTIAVTASLLGRNLPLAAISVTVTLLGTFQALAPQEEAVAAHVMLLGPPTRKALPEGAEPPTDPTAPMATVLDTGDGTAGSGRTPGAACRDPAGRSVALPRSCHP